MGFISGLKELFKKGIFAFILLSFILSWFLILFGITFIPSANFQIFAGWFIAILIGFNIVLFIFSFFKSVDKMGTALIIIAFIISLPLLIIFAAIVGLFFIFCFFANLILTSFFYFKGSIDSATKVDDYLYKKKGSRKVTRIIEFLIFGILDLGLLILTAIFFRSINPASFIIFQIIFYVNLILIGFVILRLLFTKKFAAYITLFFLLSLFYIIYIIIDIFAEILFTGLGTYNWISFFIDLVLFLYIIGAIYDRVDYLKEKLIIFRADTIALFVIIIKLLVKINELLNLGAPPNVTEELMVLFVFIAFNLLIGIYSIFAHKEGKTGK